MRTQLFSQMVRIVSVSALFTAATVGIASAEVSIKESFDKSGGNSDIKGGVEADARFLSCDGDDIDEAADWAAEFSEAAMKGPDAMVNFIVENPPPSSCPVSGEHYTELKAEAEAWGRVFGKERTLADITIKASTKDNTSRAYGRLRVKGETVWEEDKSALMFVKGASFDETKKYGLGPLSIKVKGKASAFIGISVGGGAGPGYVGLVGAPFVNASASGSASVSALCAGVSVKGEIDLIHASLPVEMSIDLDEGTWAMGADFEYDLPNGELKLKADWCTGSDSLTIAKFSMGGQDIDLIDISGEL